MTVFRFESKGVVSVRGEFTIEKDSIQGEFRVGAAPDIVEKFPGAREEVFTSAEGNYLWTTVNVTGPLKKPRP
ncbi:MAG: hypothetical protein H7Y20_19840 [Bryobacteraceae bacterium]|nr:hypothetical protein [Bryobacteraceae bacterium]